MALDDAQRRNFLQREVAADLLFIWDEAGVALEHQYDLGQNYRSIRKFAAIGDTKAEVRAAFAADFGVDIAAGAARRAEMACLVTAWQVGVEVTEKEIQARVEAKNLGVPRQVTHADRIALLSAFERVHGRLEDRETPSADYISQKVEEVEQGELLASLLDEVGSKEESLTLGVQSSLDTAGRLRITREKKKSKLPGNSEELRAKLKLEGNTLIMLGAKFRNRAWFQGLVPNDFSKYADWLLGEKVFNLQIPKSATEGMRALNPPTWIPNKFQRKGKGKGKQGRFDKRYGYLHSTTPDGRQICYAFQEGKCRGNCGRVDVCQLCLKPHPLKDCKFKSKAANLHEDKEEKKQE